MGKRNRDSQLNAAKAAAWQDRANIDAASASEADSRTNQEAEEQEIEKELRLEAYCADAHSGREIRFHENEEKLNRNQITFANLIGLEFDE